MLSRFIIASVFGIHAIDLSVYAGVAVILTLAAVLACAFPAGRAAQPDPLQSLREE